MGSARLGFTSDLADQVFLQNADQCRSRDAFSGQSSKPLSDWLSPVELLSDWFSPVELLSDWFSPGELLYD